MSAYWVGDTPALPLVLVPTRDGDELELEAYTTAAATLVKADGSTASPVASFETVDDELELHVQLPALDVAGLGWLTVTLATAEGKTDRLDPVPVVVQAETGWHTIGTARAEWRDATSIDDVRLYVLLEVARVECEAYAPALPAGQPIPVNYREAQLMHARNRLAAGLVDPSGGGAGGDSFQIAAFPLDWLVKQTLRPQRGAKVFR